MPLPADVGLKFERAEMDVWRLYERLMKLSLSQLLSDVNTIWLSLI